MSTPLLSIRGLRTTLATERGQVTVVDGVDLDVQPGEMLGLVGESGSGKSMTLRSILRLIRAPGRVTGRVLWRGRIWCHCARPRCAPFAAAKSA